MRFVLPLLFLASAVAQAPITVADTPAAARTPQGLYISWKEHLVDDEQLGRVAIRGADGLKLADFDRDGFMDVVSVHEDNHHIRLAFGSKDPDRWRLATLAEGKEAPAAEDVAVADVNGDGWMDIVAACELAHLIYFENPGRNVREGKWRRTIPPVTINRGSWIRVFFADFNRDGRMEVVAANKGEQLPTIDPKVSPFVAGTSRPKKEISWFELPRNALDGAGWKEHVLARVEVPINSQPVDLDGDGDIDVVGGSAGEGKIVFLENVTPKGGAIAFREHAVRIEGRTRPACRAHKCLGGMHMVFIDLSGDGKLDIAMHEDTNHIVWIEQPASVTGAWQLHSIGDIAPDASTGITIADINGDGRPDLMTGGYSQDPRDRDGPNITAKSTAGRIAWFEHPSDAKQRWTRHDITRRKRGMFDEFIARDMDGDGDLDFVATRGNSGNFDGVFWLEQVRTKMPVKSFQQARAQDSGNLPLP